MKRTYVTPTMVSEEFVADQYVAACYRIKCNVPGTGDGYYEADGVSGLSAGDKKVVENEVACNYSQVVVMDEGWSPMQGYWVTGRGDNKTVTNCTYFRARVWGDWGNSGHHFHVGSYDQVANASTSN